MASLTYLNFDLTFESSADGYTVRVTDSPAGQASAPFVFPFNELELENFLLRLGQRSSGTRRADSPEMELSKQFGGRLFDALFDDDVRAALRSSVGESECQGTGLRIRLRFGNAPELADIPWEYLYDSGANRFLTLSRETPLVRYLDLARSIEPMRVEAPLRILVMISDPSDYDRLDVEAEWERLTAALADLRGRGLVEIVRLDKATLLELQRVLRDNQFHIFHYIGHGVFDAGVDDGFLVIEDENGRGRKVGGQYVGTLLADHRSLRLALLNSCEGGRSSRSDPFAGAAQSLVQQGLPAVVAMQFEITDDAAAVFAHEFYMSLADGYPVDAALAEGRRAIFATKTNAEWGIPVLFMRTEDGRIFDVQAAAPPATPSPPPTLPVAEQQAAVPPVASPAAIQPDTASSHSAQPDAQRSTIPLAPPANELEETTSASTLQDVASVKWSKTIRSTGSTPNDLQMVRIIGGTILGAFLVMALVFYLIFRNATEQATPAALLPPVIEFFEVEPDELVSGSGESARVSWRISGDVTGVVISGPGIDPSLVLSRTGSLAIFPEQSATLRLTARNYDQAVSQQATVEVVQPTPAPVNAPTASLTDAYDVTVTFNSVRIIDDCDGALTGLGEFWLEMTVNQQRLRWPESGTNEVDSGQSYAIGYSTVLTLSGDERLEITAAGFESDETQIESTGSVRVVHSAADGWGVGGASQTSLAVCQFTLNYEIAASSKASTEPDDSQASEQGTPLSGEVAFALTFDNLSAFPQPTAGPGGTSNLTTNDFRQAVAGDGAHFAAGRWARFPFREGNNLAFSPTAGELEFWYKPDFAFSAEPYPRYLVVVGDVYNPPHLMFFHYDDLIFQIGVGLESGQFLEVRSAERFSDLWEAGQPVHLRVVWNVTAADPVQMYVDWVRVDDGTKPIQISDADFEDVDYLYIGAASALGENSAEGLFDELIIRR